MGPPFPTQYYSHNLDLGPFGVWKKWSKHLVWRCHRCLAAFSLKFLSFRWWCSMTRWSLETHVSPQWLMLPFCLVWGFLQLHEFSPSKHALIWVCPNISSAHLHSSQETVACLARCFVPWQASAKWWCIPWDRKKNKKITTKKHIQDENPWKFGKLTMGKGVPSIGKSLRKSVIKPSRNQLGFFGKNGQKVCDSLKSPERPIAVF